MRHIACHTDGCDNHGAPYHDFEDDHVIVLCPVCAHAMKKIPTPDLSPPTLAADTNEGGE